VTASHDVLIINTGHNKPTEGLSWNCTLQLIIEADA